MQMDTFRIDEIARRLMDNLPPAFRATQRDLESNFRAVLRAGLGKLDLVTRDEFDTQSRVLERTRARLEALEARVRELEAAPPGGAGEEAAPPTSQPS
jgi:ubiquinone biosynthesis accessory factor UbiK